MRKTMILPAMALSLLGFGMVAEAVPAGAAVHHSVSAQEADDDDDDDDGDDDLLENGGAGAGAPSGGAATGAGGTAADSAESAAPWLLTGAAGLGLVGIGATTRRRRTVKA